MLPASVLLVVRSTPAPDVTKALQRALTPFQAMSAPEVMSWVQRGTAHTVVLERLPGWPALVRDVELAGASALLVGPPVSDAEDALLPPGVEWIQDLA